MWRNVLWTAVVATSACLIPDRLILEALDRDRDGELNGDYHGEFGDGTDCDDNDPAVGADMPETCGDGTDNDCDGDIDEDSPEAPIWFFDRDGDGHGDADRPRSACTKPSDHEPDATDCDDNQPAAHPGAVERCNGLDDDCDGDIDESGDPITWYADQDGDGHGDPTSAQVVCERPRGHVQTATDCNDHADWIHPGSFEVWYDGVDADCRGDDDFDRDDDGARHPSAWADAPPWDAVVDCDDGNRRIYPSAPEIWYDGVDQDCDPETEWDFDRDGLTHPSAPVGTAEDCDDARADIGAPRWWFPDSDGDSYGATGAGTSSCSSLTGHVTNGLDCDDGEPDINPDGLEACNGVDDDCDGATDEHGGPAWWPDLDGDGQGDESANPNFACATPQDHVQNADDCDDTNPLTGRGFNEICDGEDNNCNNRVDEGVVPNWYPDDDHDDFGDANVQPYAACEPPPGDWTHDHTDCDDDRFETNPGGIEVCNGHDDDCERGVDDGVLLAWYPDADQDGFGEQPTAVRDPVVWACSAPPGHLADHTDCDDSDGDVFLGNTENIAGVTIFPHDLCDGVDNDCMPGNDVDPPAVCGPGSQEFTWGGSRYLLRDRNLYDTPRAEEWCTERGYHLWHVGAGGGSEHTFVAGSYALPPIITGVGTTIPARAHVGARTQCPTASTFIPCFLSPSGVVCLPSQREQWQWWDPRTYTCWSAVDDMPSWMPESSGDYLVVHNLLNTFLPNLTVADPEDDAYVICERELP